MVGQRNNSFVSTLFSPAVSLAILGTLAFIFSFFRAGQLSSLVVQKAVPEKSVAKETTIKVPPEVDVNSRDLLKAIDQSLAGKLAMSKKYKDAVEEAQRNLSDGPRNYVPGIALAGDIFSQSEDRQEQDIGFALLARAVSMTPDNQYLAVRYCQRLAAKHEKERAIKMLINLAHAHPQWGVVHLMLGKLYFLQGANDLSVGELAKLKNGEDLNAKEQEEVGLILVKAGGTYDGYKYFKLAVSGKPETRFYSFYCPEASIDADETALAAIDAHLANNTNSLSLEIKKVALLLLLGHNQEAKVVLQKSMVRHENNFDLQVLLAATNFALGQSDQAFTDFEKAAKYYEPSL